MTQITLLLLQQMRSGSIIGTDFTPWIRYLSSFNECFCYTSIPATVTRCDEISNATALQESGSRNLSFAKKFGKGDHLHEAKANNSSFGIVTVAKAITETSSYCYYILLGTEIRNYSITAYRCPKEWQTPYYWQTRLLVWVILVWPFWCLWDNLKKNF